jgi:hypothetical protein
MFQQVAARYPLLSAITPPPLSCHKLVGRGDADLRVFGVLFENVWKRSSQRRGFRGIHASGADCSVELDNESIGVSRVKVSAGRRRCEPSSRGMATLLASEPLPQNTMPAASTPGVVSYMILTGLAGILPGLIAAEWDGTARSTMSWEETQHEANTIPPVGHLGVSGHPRAAVRGTGGDGLRSEPTAIPASGVWRRRGAGRPGEPPGHPTDPDLGHIPVGSSPALAAGMHTPDLPVLHLSGWSAPRLHLPRLACRPGVPAPAGLDARTRREGKRQLQRPLVAAERPATGHDASGVTPPNGTTSRAWASISPGRPQKPGPRVCSSRR